MNSQATIPDLLLLPPGLQHTPLVKSTKLKRCTSVVGYSLLSLCSSIVFTHYPLFGRKTLANPTMMNREGKSWLRSTKFVMETNCYSFPTYTILS